MRSLAVGTKAATWVRLRKAAPRPAAMVIAIGTPVRIARPLPEVVIKAAPPALRCAMDLAPRMDLAAQSFAVLTATVVTTSAAHRPTALKVPALVMEASAVLTKIAEVQRLNVVPHRKVAAQHPRGDVLKANAAPKSAVVPAQKDAPIAPIIHAEGRARPKSAAVVPEQPNTLPPTPHQP